MAEQILSDLYPEYDPRLLDIGYSTTEDRPKSLLEIKQQELAQAKAEKLKQIDSTAWATSEEQGTTTGFLSELGARIGSSFGTAGSTLLRVPSNIQKSIATDFLEPDALNIANQAKRAEQAIASLKSVANPNDPRIQAMVNSEQQKLNQANTYLDQPRQAKTGLFTNTSVGLASLFGDIQRPKTQREAVALLNKANRPNTLTELANTTDQYWNSAINPLATEAVEPIFEEAGAKAAKAWEEGNIVTGSIGWLGNQMLGVVEGLATDPKAAVQMMAQSVVQTLAAANPATATAVYGPMFIEAVDKGITDFRREHDGKNPTDEEVSVIQGMAALGTASDFISDAVLLRLTPGITKLLNKYNDVIPASQKADIVKKYPRLQETLIETAKVAAIPAGEALQGSFQNFAEQYAGKQDLSEIDTEEVATSGIEEGFAASTVGGVRAVTSPSTIAKAGTTNKALEASTKAVENFRETQAYQDLPETSKSNVEAYRAFEKAINDKANPEIQQSTLNEAISALTTTPKFNTAAIGSKIKGLIESNNLTVPEEINTLLDSMTKPVDTITSKTLESVGKAVNKVADTYKDTVADIKGRAITDDLITKDPEKALDLLFSKGIQSKTIDEFNEEKKDILANLDKISDAISALPSTTEEQGKYKKTLSDKNAEYVQLLVKAKQALLNPETVINEVVNAKDTTTTTFGARAKDLDTVLITSTNLTEKQLDAIEQSKNTTDTQKELASKLRDYSIFRKNSGQVNRNVTNESDQWMKSTKEYVGTIQSAIELGDANAARASLLEFTRFANNHAAKADRVSKGLEEAIDTGKVVKVEQNLKDESGKPYLLGIIPGNKASEALANSIIAEGELVTLALGVITKEFNEAFPKKESSKKPVEQPTAASSTPTGTQVPPSQEVSPKAPVEASTTTPVATTPVVSPEVSPEAQEGSTTASTGQGNVEVARETEVVSQVPTEPSQEEIDAAFDEASERDEYDPSLDENPDGVEEDLDTVGEVDPDAYSREYGDDATKGELKSGKYNDSITFGKSIYTSKTYDDTLASIVNTLADVPEIGGNKGTNLEFKNLVRLLSNTINTNNFTQYHNEEESPLVQLMSPNKRYINKQVTLAMAIAGYNYLLTRGNETLFNSINDIKSMLGYDSQDPLPTEAIEMFQDIGLDMKLVASTLGQDIMRSLRITMSTEVETNRMQMALGMTTIASLANLNFMQQVSMPITLFNEFKSEPSEVSNPNAVVNFTSLNAGYSLNEDGTKSIRYQNQRFANLVSRMSKEHLAAIKNLFDVSDKVIRPRFTPKYTKVPKYQKGTRQQLPPKVVEAIEANNKRPYSFNTIVYESIMSAYTSEDPEVRLAMLRSFGYVTDFTGLHKADQVTHESKNRQLIKELDALKEFGDILKERGSLTKSIYFSYESWVNTRLGIKNDTGINPLQSKLVRSMVSLKKPKSKAVPLGSKASAFYLRAIADTFGIATDKVKPAEFASKFDQLLTVPEIAAVLDIFKSEKGFDYANKDHLLKLTEVQKVFSKEDPAQLYEGLLKLGQLSAYIGDGPIKSSMLPNDIYIQQDGVSNGLAIAHMQAGEVDSRKLAGFGLFSDPDTKEFTEADREDTYERITSNLLNDLFANQTNRQDIAVILKNLGDIYKQEGSSITITSAGRKLTKYPAIAAVYGQGTRSLARTLTDTFINNIYSKLSSIQGDDIVRKQVLEEVNKDINQVVGAGLTKRVLKRDFVFTADNYLNTWIHPALVNQITELISVLVADTLSENLRKDFPQVFELRNAVNTTADRLSSLFIQAVNKKIGDSILTRDMLQELVTKPIAEGGLREIAPVFKTSSSTTIEDGYLAVKVQKGYSNKPGSKVKTSYKQNTVPVVSYTRKGDRIVKSNLTTSSHTGNSKEIVLESNGTSTFVSLILSIDAKQVHEVVTKHDVFTVHDAIIVDPVNADKVGKDNNKIFLDINYDYFVGNSIQERTKEILDYLQSNKDIEKLLGTKAFNTVVNSIKEANDSSNTIFEVSKVRRAKMFEEAIGSSSQFASLGTVVPSPYYKGKPTTVSKALEQAAEEIVEQDVFADKVAAEIMKTRKANAKAFNTLAEGTQTKAIREAISRVKPDYIGRDTRTAKQLLEAIKCRIG
jgi:hypothetical protein